MPSSSLSYRKARLGDAASMRALMGELGYEGLPDRGYAETFPCVVAHPEFGAWVAADGVIVVGAIVFSHRPQLHLAGLVGSIDELVVAASHRGRGIGARLLELAMARARELKCVRVEIQTQRSRESYSRGFYEKHGFAEVESALLRFSLR